jgi:hypothetical protein
MEEVIAQAIQRDREVNPHAHPELARASEEEDSEEQVLDQEYLEFLEEQEREEGPPVE